MREYEKPSVISLVFKIEEVLSSSQEKDPLDYDTDINDTLD